MLRYSSRPGLPDPLSGLGRDDIYDHPAASRPRTATTQCRHRQRQDAGLAAANTVYRAVHAMPATRPARGTIPSWAKASAPSCRCNRRRLGVSKVLGLTNASRRTLQHDGQS